MASKTVRKCYCGDTGAKGAPHAPHGRARKLKGVEALLDDLESLRDGTDEGIGMLLRRAKEEILRGQRVRAALESLVAAHDQTPPMLTEEEWTEARAALAAAGPGSPATPIIVITMESESKDWIAVGRTEAEARAALAKKWDEEVPPAGGETWKQIKSSDKGDAADYYGACVMHVLPGRAYVDGFDERDSR